MLGNVEGTTKGYDMSFDDVQVRAIDKNQIPSNQLPALLDFFRNGYGERWIGDGNFWQVMMKNCTELLGIYSGSSLAAAFLLDHLRISDICVSPDFQGEGFGGRLFKEAARLHPDVWITVGVDAEGMLATVTSEELNFLPVEEGEKIKTLFKEINRGKDNFQIETTLVKVPLLAKRLAQKGIDRDLFTAFNRVGATHGRAYKQILFQNQSKLS